MMLIVERRVRQKDGSFETLEVDVAAQILRYVRYRAVLQGWKPPAWALRP